MAVVENLEAEDAGEKDWLMQMRKLIRTAIYNISYTRGLYPEDYFQDTSFSESGLIVKKLISKDSESRRLVDWIELGVDDALRKKYLEIAVFQICDKNEGAVIDEYSFTFRYPSHDTAVMEFSLAGSKENNAIFKSNPAEATDLQIRSLIRICASIMSTLAPIPDERTILMKLLYYDQMTPEDYEPPLFECCVDEDDLAQSFGRLCCITKKGPIFLLDSGATHHICCNKSYMTEMRNISKNKQIELTTADGGKFKAKETGLIDIGSIHLNQVRYIPEMNFNVVSIGYLDKQGLLISIVNSEIFIIDVSKGIHVGEGYRHRTNNDYILKAMKWMAHDDVELQQTLEDDDSESWIIDSCCASHMAGSLEMLTNPKPYYHEFHTPSGRMTSSHRGSVRDANVQLPGVLYCPDNSNNLISVGLLDSQGHRIIFYDGVCNIVCKETLEVVGWGMLHDSSLLYHLQRLLTKNVISKGKRKNSKK